MSSPVTHILVDAHVHIQRTYEISSFFSGCLQNFAQVSQRFPSSSPEAYFLLLAETKKSHFFDSLKDKAILDSTGLQIRVIETKEHYTLCLQAEDGHEVYVVNGQQIVTKENLEILALGLSYKYPEGLSFREVVEDVIARDCIVALPWGVGKWLGSRGQLIRDAVDTWRDSPTFFLGDNGNRPNFWPLPKVFQYAFSKGVRNLPGSDPLALSHHERRAGSYGAAFYARLDSQQPFRSIREQLISKDSGLRVFGIPCSCKQFFADQLLMQAYKRFKK